MDKQLLKDALGWGFALWLIGYILGMALYFVVPVPMIGWILMPIGIVITSWVLFKKVRGDSFWYYLFLGIIWALIAIVFDYFFLVKLLKPAEFYYKFDVFLYYALTFALPLIVYWFKKGNKVPDNFYKS